LLHCLRACQAYCGVDQRRNLGQGSSEFAATDELAEAIEDVACTLCLLHDFGHTLVNQCRLWHRPGQQPQATPGIGDDRGQRLAQLVRQSRGHFTRQRNPRDVSQLRLVLAVASFGFPAGSDVTHDERVMFSAHQVEAASAELDRECTAIRPPRIKFPTT
jgi:hypothetical protein